MKSIPEVNEIAFTLFAEEIIPTHLTPKFLKLSQIVPQDWKFVSSPKIEIEKGEAIFTNGVNISANVGSITFSQKLNANNLEKIQVFNLATKWVEIQHKFNYQAIEINPTSLFSFKQENNIFRHFIPNILLIDGDWKKASQEPLRGSLSLAYTIKQKEFNIKIEDIRYREADNSLIAGAIFYGNFFYEVKGNTKAEKLKRINQYLSLWQEDWEIFQDLVNNKLLQNI